jgi:ABC-type Fe3+-hydroxamate transport system substrate-binding protein
MPSFADQLGNTISLVGIPSRIISLVPSQTELLFDLGLDEQVTGITKFCVHPPPWWYTKTRVGGTKKLHFNTIHQLRPDLIIANKEENTKEEIEELARSYPVWTSDIKTLNDAYEMILQVGIITGTQTRARNIVNIIRHEFNNFRKMLYDAPAIPASYLIWNDPMMTVGGDTFINAMLEQAGFKNTFESRDRYPRITIDDIRNAGCQIIMLSSEPFPFKQSHADLLKAQLPGVKVVLVDGQMFSWYGSRLQYAPRYFLQLFDDCK